ncbi:hypothetical protein H0194_04145 [Corynebacterium incognita]|uniref:Uncharacterized protein n=1 Tax=Corynebacterium incognita TaxID=2754725 RepID=A0A7G7CRG6_9CORY|nr:hypothetical protein [Corynebacterium incognita]QNE90182.1 hypothetical protein H0194_04145 [Corynebacterium incognita]
MSEFLTGSSEFAAKLEGFEFITTIGAFVTPLFELMKPLAKAAGGASDLIGLIA